jgi:hypothetical protein
MMMSEHEQLELWDPDWEFEDDDELEEDESE